MKNLKQEVFQSFLKELVNNFDEQNLSFNKSSKAQDGKLKEISNDLVEIKKITHALDQLHLASGKMKNKKRFLNRKHDTCRTCRHQYDGEVLH
ncbi:hypothetical protein D1B33_03730 [Lysinibacillus yapensis]|uniref:Uncharacterized protein n=1 Tax=Ureibacillus yapensis TaxID=2304605 RepID=A0A396SLP5_9BACL|nr:hypothetical protein [Lysinibacillus yapensis]RHW39967.1 hypothetical protein D1B33_03730 [Lysinibacillus yapensis]